MHYVVTHIHKYTQPTQFYINNAMSKSSDITDHRPEVQNITDHRSDITGHRSHITDHRSHIIDHKIRLYDL